jgi:hypothetical protein
MPMGPKRDEQSSQIVPSFKKLVQWQVAITQGDLEAKLRRAFDATKQESHKFDVTFIGQSR